MSSLNLLLVVDEQDRMMLVEFLLRRDCQVQVVGNYDQALQTFQDRIIQPSPTTSSSQMSPPHVMVPALPNPCANAAGTRLAISWIADFQDNNDDLHRMQSGLQVDQIFTKPVDLAMLARYVEQKQQALRSGLSMMSGTQIDSRR